MAASDYVESAMDLLGGEDTEFKLSVRDGKVLMTCGYGDCPWGYTIGTMDLWEFTVDAREHWDTDHG